MNYMFLMKENCIRPLLQLLPVGLWLLAFPAQSQEAGPLHAHYTVSTEVAVGSGDYTAYQLVANQHDVLSHKANTGYMRAAFDVDKAMPGGWILTGAFDAVAAVGGKQDFYLQQCFANLAWKGLFIEAGARESDPVLVNRTLSSGALVWSGNSRPLPQVHVGTQGYYSVPGSGERLQVLIDFGYGCFFDDDWKTRQFDAYHAQHKGSFLTNDVWYHQKKFYIRSNPARRFYLTFGVEHAVQFGGEKASYETGQLTTVSIRPSFTDFLKVLIPSEGGSTDDKGAANFISGNHVGSWSLAPTWNITSEKHLTAYLENMFEDGSGLRKGNAWDGLWGLEYRNGSDAPQWIRGVVLEYLYTMDQSGPIHWAPNDFDSSVSSAIPAEATGNDNYYNHYFYNGYAHFGQAMGSPLLTSPAYNQDCFLAFRDNRVKAFHAAMEGEFTDRWSYLLKGSYRESRGTYFVPSQHRRHSFDILLQAGYRLSPSWQFSAAYGLSKGTILGNCSTFDFKAVYHGKIL